MKRTGRLALAVCTILLTVASSYATTVERLQLQDLVRKARTIVAGKVTRARTYWSADGKLILTDYTIEVAENIKGRPGRTVSVTTIGGKIGDVELHASGMPVFDAGEDSIVFLEQSGAYQTIVGLGQGKFRIRNGEVSNSVGGLAFPDGRPGVPLQMPVENFKTQIRKLLGR
jgi:hypothetical protein